MSEWSELFKTGIALLAIVNPIGGVPLFVSATTGISAHARNHTARTVGVTVFVVLGLAALLGTRILDFFGISIPSFLVGGGILLLLLAVSMLQAKESGIRQTPAEAQEVAERHAIGVVPLGIPLLAGPGAISTVIIATHKAPSFAHQLRLFIPIAVIALIVWVTLLVAARISSRMGTIGINIITRIMGLILAAMAVEFMVRGITELFPALTKV
ncbi:MAG: NAAT family transporter [Betaproteobacteria bacterium]|nr:NAAT family transporter [Betaproteobacteria bacterium]